MRTTLIWLAVAVVTRLSSLAALVSAGLMPLVMLLAGYGQMLVLSVLLAALLFYRHRENIARLRAGTESRIGAKG